MIPQLLILWRASSSKASASGPFNLIPNETDVEAAVGGLDEEKNDMTNLLTTRLLGPFGIDIGMWAYILSVAAFRIFYVNHWIWRYRATRTSDPIALSSALTQLFTFTIFLCALVLRRVMWRWRKLAIGSGPGVLDAFPRTSLPSSRIFPQSLRIGVNVMAASRGRKKPGIKKLGAVKLKVLSQTKERDIDALETIDEMPEEPAN